MWASGGRRGYLDEERTDPRRVDPEARAAAFKSAHGYNAAGVLPSMAKLVLIASNFPDKHEVLARLQCMGAEYDYDTHTAQSLVELIEAAVHQNEAPLGAICVLMAGSCAAGGSELLNLSSALVLRSKENEAAFFSQSAGLYVGGGDVLKVLKALGTAVRDNGRVDLIGCRLASTPDGKALLKTVGAQTATHMAATDNRNGAWLTASDGFDKKGLPCTKTFDAKRHYLADENAGSPPAEAINLRPPVPMQPPRATGLSASTFTFVG